jgi:hypothetical protein
MIGFTLDPWQEFVLAESLGERADGNWSAFEVGLVVARQNGKSELLAARQLVGLFVLHEQMIIHTAQQFDTAKEVFRRVEDVIDGEPMLKRRVDLNRGRVGKWANGQEGIELLDGCRLRYRARGAGGGGRGFTADCLMFDEAMILSDATVGAVLPLLSSVPYPQVWYAGSAVDQMIHEHGMVLSKLRDRGMTGTDPQLAYFEWSAPGDDPEALVEEDFANQEFRQAANPAYEIRITDDYITREIRGMPRRQAAVERFGVGDWFDTSEDAGRVIPRAAWAACAERDNTKLITSDPFFAVDADPEQRWASIAVGGKRADGLIQVAVVDRRPRTEWLVESVANLREHHPHGKFVIDKGGPVSDLIERLDAIGIKGKRVVAADTTFYRNACVGFVTAVTGENPQLRYPFPQPELDDALAAAVKAPMVDSWKWSRVKSTQADISPLVACTLAYWATTSLLKARARAIDPNAILAAKN